LTTVLWPLLTSLGLVMTTFFIGKELWNVEIGLLSAFLASFSPVDVINATRLDTDIVLAFFMALSVLFFLRSVKNKNYRRFNYLSAGTCIGFSYLVKLFVVLLPFIFFIYLLYKKKINKKILFLILGFLMVFILEGFYFYLTSGHFLLHYEICSVAPRDYALKTLAGNFYISEWLNVLYYYRPPLYYFPYLFNIHSIASDTSFPEIWHFSYLLIFSIIVLFLIKKHKKIFFPLLWFSGLLFMEFGFIGIEFFL